MTADFEDLRQSEEWATYLSQLGWLTVIAKSKPACRQGRKQKAKIFIRKLPLMGAVGKIQRPSVIPPIEEIDRIAKKHRALFIKLEPSLQSFNHSTIQPFESDNWPLAPTRTIHIDLTPDEEEIFARFSKDARYSVRKARRGGVEVGSWRLEVGNLETFYNLLRKTGRRKKFWVAPFRDLEAKAGAFKDKSTLVLAYRNYVRKHDLVAGALILFHDQVAYYHHAASNLEGRKLLAPYLVVWEAIKLAKKRGCHTLDLEGIYDPRYKIYQRFRKIGTFKKKFGGRVVEYPGSFIRYYNPVVKLIFKLTSWR